MPARPKLPRLKVGVPLVDDWIDRLVSEVEASRNVTASGQVSCSVHPGGVDFFIPPTVQVRVAYTTTTVAPATGTFPTVTPGSGTVTLLGWNGTTTTADETGVAAKNLFTSTVSGQTYSVASGKACVVVKLFGLWWIIAADC